MTMLDITLLEQHMQILMGLLPDATSPEAAAYILFGSSDIAADPWSGDPRHRLISHRVIEITRAGVDELRHVPISHRRNAALRERLL